MWHWLKNFLGIQVAAQSADGISPLVDRSALADFVRLLHEADRDEPAIDQSTNLDPI
jgi:hypothetical protein